MCQKNFITPDARMMIRRTPNIQHLNQWHSSVGTLRSSYSDMDPRTASKCAIGIIASIGCFIQLQSTLVAYFSYSTITRTASQSPRILEIMSLSLCVSYADMLDPKYIENLVPLKFWKLSRDERRAAIQDFLTIKQIFDATPSNESLMSGCAIRSKSPRVLYRPKTIDECHSLIKVKKYYTQEFMCYMFIPKNISINYLTYIISSTTRRNIRSATLR